MNDPYAVIMLVSIIATYAAFAVNVLNSPRRY